jgi:hypothetical protein
VTFVINWNLSALESLTIGGHEITVTPSPEAGKKLLSGYPGYSGYIGEAVSGSTEITLYGSFIDALAAADSGQYEMAANFGESHEASTTFTAQSSPERSNHGCDAGFGAAGLFALALLTLARSAWKRG